MEPTYKQISELLTSNASLSVFRNFGDLTRVHILQLPQKTQKHKNGVQFIQFIYFFLYSLLLTLPCHVENRSNKPCVLKHLKKKSNGVVSGDLEG